MEKKIQVGETKGFLFFIGNFFFRKTGKVTKFGLITNSASKIMQKKPGSWYKVHLNSKVVVRRTFKFKNYALTVESSYKSKMLFSQYRIRPLIDNTFSISFIIYDIFTVI